ncbi:hypothetical protein NST58_14710 [Paenibacillus sp. FSL R10-2796]|uniref:hypothetical protein n=1 Tax=Paenibacillus sp. FSL R10-2796 TaxID=2954663 RepID=UPI0030DAA74A
MKRIILKMQMSNWTKCLLCVIPRSMWVPGVILQAKMLKAIGHVEDAAEVLQTAIAELKQYHSPGRERLLEAAYIRIQFSQGLLSSGDEWLTKRHISANDKPNVAREYEQITLARMLMARQAYQKLEVKKPGTSRF